jgi:hypothetical protein
VAWLLDVVPPDYRLYGVLRRHPIALAIMAKYHLAACVEGARQGYRSTRTELSGLLPAHGVDAVLTAYRTEGRRLVDTAQAVDLITRALRGEEFKPRLRTEGSRRQKNSGTTTPRESNPRESSPRQGSPRESNPRQTSPRESSPRRAAPGRPVPGKAAADGTVPSGVAPSRVVAGEQPPTKHGLAEQPPAERSLRAPER